MNPFLDFSRRFLLTSGRNLSSAWKHTLKWLSVPVDLCLTVLGLVFLVSLVSWAATSAFEEVVLFYPDSGGTLRGELREVPHSFGSEARAELIASEVLLGPKDVSLVTAFSPGVRLESAIYRKGRLFIDISPEAALDPPNSLKNGMKAMERSLRAALPGMKRLSLTIGGEEPYVEGIQIEGATGIKKAGK